jgi:CRISPR/Cas system-associated exonuclease Cas4 (RecB family)
MTGPVRLTHSYSSIKQYENCPKRYFHQRIEKSVEDKGGEASRYGEQVHKALEDNIREGAPLPAPLRKYEDMCSVVKQKAEGADLTAEIEMSVDADFVPTGWWDPDVFIRSKLDVLIVKDDKAIVLDWKTGKRRPDPFQLDLFSLQVFSHYEHINKVYSSFVWLPDQTTDMTISYRQDVPTLKQDTMARIRRIEESQTHDNWPARPSGLCSYCPCKSFCEFSKAR